MHFITENELRQKYRGQSFEGFEVPPDCRLTPGARQFLLDKGLKLYDKKSPKTNKAAQEKEIKEKHLEEQCAEDKLCKKNKVKKLRRKLKFLYSESLYSAAKLLEVYPDISRKLAKISNELSILIRGFECISNFNCSIVDAKSQEKVDCMSINEFHIQSKGAKHLLMLHRLVSLFDIFYEDVDESEDISTENKEILKKWVLQTINELSLIINTSFGS